MSTYIYNICYVFIKESPLPISPGVGDQAIAEEACDGGSPPPGLGRHPADAFGGGSTLLSLHKR